MSYDYQNGWKLQSSSLHQSTKVIRMLFVYYFTEVYYQLVQNTHYNSVVYVL